MKDSISVFLNSVATLCILFFLVSCSGSTNAPARASSGSLDKPDFHIQRGDKALLDDDYAAAEKSYAAALELDPANIYAQSGDLLSKVYLASDPANAAAVKRNALAHIEKLEGLLSEANDKEETKRILTYSLRAKTALKLPADWYTQVEDIYSELESQQLVDAESRFFRAEADTENLQIKAAIDRYESIIGTGSPYADRADRKLEILQKIRRVLPISPFAKDIAFAKSISRADVAGLLVIELNIDTLFSAASTQSNTDFRKPASQTRSTLTETRVQQAVDIQGHPMVDVITRVLKLGIRGLEADASGKFYPDQPLSRAEMAVIIEDILIKMTNDQTIATKYIGDTSPFPDVASDKWFYNAARVVTERQLLPQGDKLSGAFKPLMPIAGVDALIAVKEFKNAR